MLISPVRFNNSFSKIYNNKKTSSNTNNEIKNDVFINASAISFGSSLKEERHGKVDFLINLFVLNVPEIRK